ncbi:RING-type E3 ubiquitin transferase [Ranunculus cassubicifolius]
MNQSIQWSSTPVEVILQWQIQVSEFSDIFSDIYLKSNWDCIKTFPDLSSSGKVTSVKFGLDAKYLAAGCMDSNLHVYGLSDKLESEVFILSDEDGRKEILEDLRSQIGNV